MFARVNKLLIRTLQPDLHTMCYRAGFSFFFQIINSKTTIKCQKVKQTADLTS